METNNLSQSIDQLEKEVNSLHGKFSLLEEQYTENLDKIAQLKQEQECNTKGIELLNFVQKATKEKIKDTFENIVTKALQFIHQNNEYKFTLDFDRRGNVPTLDFNVKTSEMKELHDIIATKGGGTTDIISFALRFVLLEISKNKGFVFFDEPFSHLDSPETAMKAIEFFKTIQKESGKQIFIITHRQDIVESVENPIILK